MTDPTTSHLAAVQGRVVSGTSTREWKVRRQDSGALRSRIVHPPQGGRLFTRGTEGYR